MPYGQDVHIDQALTNLSVAYRNEAYVADRILPPVPVDFRSGRYFTYGKEPFLARDDLTRPGSTAPEWLRTVSTSFYNAERHAQRSLVTDAERRLTDNPLSAMADTTELLTDTVMNGREFAVLSTVTSTANVTQNVTLSGTTQWSDYTNSTPLVNLKTAKSTVRNGILREANSLTLSYDVALTLADHPSIKDLIKYTDPNNIASSGLPRMVRGLMVNEARAFQNTANDGATATFVTAFGKNALVHYTAPSPGLRTVSFGFVFEAPDDTTGVRGYATQTYRDDSRHGEWVECSTTYVPVLIAANGGYLLVAATA